MLRAMLRSPSVCLTQGVCCAAAAARKVQIPEVNKTKRQGRVIRVFQFEDFYFQPQFVKTDISVIQKGLDLKEIFRDRGNESKRP